jgi:hypothetical protein
LGSCHEFQVIEQQAAADSPVEVGEEWREFAGEKKRGR